jgi:4-amino-4-deoxy-L-arabinose transferase-like glycosyltransferase
VALEAEEQTIEAIMRGLNIPTKGTDPRRQHLALLSPFAIIFVAAMLSDRSRRGDEEAYIRLANHLAHGYYTDPALPHLHFGPGLPIVLAPLVAVHAPLELMRLVGPILLLLSVMLFYEVLRLFMSPYAAFAGSVAFGLYVPFYNLLPTLTSDILGVFLVTAFMYALTRYLREGGWLFLVLSGIALAWLAVARVIFGWVLAASLVIWFATWAIGRSQRSRRVLFVHMLAFSLCIPWLAYTYSLSHNPFYWGSSGGQQLYWMAAPYPGHLGDWHSSDDVFTDPNLEPDRPEFRKLLPLNEIERDKVLRRDAVKLIEEHPQKYARHVVENLSRMWFSMPYSFTQQKLSTLFYALPNAVLLVALLGSLGLLWLHRSNLPIEAAPMGLLLLLGIAAQAPLAAYSRMIVPLVPLMVAGAAYSLGHYVRVRRPSDGATGANM